MQNDVIALCYPNRIASATLSSPQAFTSALPLSNVADRVFARKARTAADTFQINGTFAKFFYLGAVAIVAHNLSTTAKWRVRLYSSAGSVGTSNNVVYDSNTVPVWPAIVPQQERKWELSNFWTGTAEAEDLAAYTPLASVITDALLCQGFTIDVSDSGNPDGYLEIGRVFISDVWQPTYTFSFGAQENVISGTTVEQALDGTEYFDVQRGQRTLEFTLQGLSESEARSRALSINRICGTDAELLFSPNQIDSVYRAGQTFVGRLEKTNPLVQVNYDWFEQSYTAKEIL